MKKELLGMFTAAVFMFMSITGSLSVMASESDPTIFIEGESISGYSTAGDPTSSGSLILVLESDTNNSVQVSFNAEQAGTYKMRFRSTTYSSWQPWLSKFSVTVNDTTWSGADLTEVSTSENNFGIYEKEVALKSGQNTYTITATTKTASEKYLIYLDYVSFDFIEDENTIFIEAENLSGYSAIDYSNASNGKIIVHETKVTQTEQDPSVTFQATAVKSGTYTMKFRSTKYPSWEPWLSQFYVTVDGEEFSGDACTAVDVSDGVMGIYEKEVYLYSGGNDISFTPTSLVDIDGTSAYRVFLDYISFTYVSDADPDAQNLSLSIEGETLDGVSTAPYPNSSGLIAVFENEINPAVKMDFYIPKSGTYKMKYRTTKYPTQGQGWLSQFDVTVNNATWSGNDSTAVNVSDGAMGIYKSEVTLNGGKNTLIFTPTSKIDINGTQMYRLYLDYVSFYYLSTAPEVNSDNVMEGETYTALSNTDASLNNVALVSDGGVTTDSGTVYYASNQTALQIAPVNSILPFTLTYEKDMEEAGNYYVYLDMVINFSGASPWLANVTLSVNNGTKISLNSTGLEKMKDLPININNQSFARYKTLDTVSMQQGTNTLTLEVTKDSGQAWTYLDKMELEHEVTYQGMYIQSDADILSVDDTMSTAIYDEEGVQINSGNTTSITYASSNSDIVSVNAEGVITAKNIGACDVIATVTADANTYTVTKKFTVKGGEYELIIDSITMEGNSVLVKYVTTADLTAKELTFIAGRYETVDGAQTSLRELQIVPLTTVPAANLYHTITIPMDSTSGNIEVFAWNTLDGMAPVFSKLTVN